MLTPDNENSLHIRCGSDIRETLKGAGFVGEFLEFADPFCQGPVQQLKLEDFIQSRTKFISDAYLLPFNEINVRQKTEYSALDKIKNFTDITLWFEHDTYDQLILMYLLNHLSSDINIENINLICVDQVPGVDRFIGLGQLSPDQLTWLWETKKIPLTNEHLKLGKKAWGALVNPNPMALYQLTQLDVDLAIEPMKRAITRHLQQLPSLRNGLSFTQQLIIETVAENEGIIGVELFKIIMNEKESLPYLGDLMFWYELSDLVNTLKPLFHVSSPTEPWPDRRLEITDIGQDVLQGNLDFLDLYSSSRWVGAVEVRGQNPAQIRWDFENSKIVIH